ncbi:hypothetical protein [Candidatus Liberibacter brunswickensis]|uniref:hypothetical protein n=1 Tax=Candidatus Liberibacter brunswickensis TaxID=1968796 RepID=UPI002FE38A80
MDPFIGREISMPHYVQEYSLHPIQQDIHDRKNMNSLLLSDLLNQKIKDLFPNNNNVNIKKDVFTMIIL